MTENALLGISPKWRESAFRPSDGCDGRFLFWAIRRVVLTGRSREESGAADLLSPPERRGGREKQSRLFYQ